MTATLPPANPTTKSREQPESLTYGYDEETQGFFYKKNSAKVFCSASELLQITEGHDIPDEDRGALLLGIPF